MLKPYQETEAAAYVERYAALPRELALCIYTSHLLGGDSSMVLHGGGNTSVKIQTANLFGEREEILHVKGSGYDLAAIGPEGFCSLARRPLLRLRGLESLSDQDMIEQLHRCRTRADAPAPSVEALLHAFLPHTYVDHTHADSILVLTHQPDGAALVQQILGPRVAVLPYEKSGLPLARAVAEAVEKNPALEGVVIVNHGIFTFADDARTAYERMIRRVGQAAVFVDERLKKTAAPVGPSAKARVDLIRSAQVLRGICTREADGGRLQRLHADLRGTPEMAAASLSPQAAEICRSGVLTPDHAIRTKNRMVYIDNVPEDDAALKDCLRRAVDDFRRDYGAYCERYRELKRSAPARTDPDPVVFLVAGAGLIALAPSLADACAAADIAEHTVAAKMQAFAVGDYEPTPLPQTAAMEFWRLQERKRRRVDPAPLQGQIAVVSGAGGAIGYGIADRLLAAGAAVALGDIDGERLDNVYHLLSQQYGKRGLMQIVFDVTEPEAVVRAYEGVAGRFGGIDIVVPNAGLARVGRIENLSLSVLDQVMAVNFKGTFTLIQSAIPVFRRQETGGSIVLISTKNVFDPGAAFGAYSASKAAAHQLAKIAALELADLKVRVNMVCPDAVFGDERVCSKLWEEVGPDRMRSRGLDEKGLQDYYCQRSLLKAKVLPAHVGNAVVFFASEMTPTTGAALPVDAGNPSTFSR